MRTNIDIDDRLMRAAMKATGARTKRATVEVALRQTVQLKKQEGIRKLRGKVVWRGHDDDWFVTDEEILTKRRKAQPSPPLGRPAVNAPARRHEPMHE